MVAAGLLAVVGLVVGGLWLGQRALIYLPDRSSPPVATGMVDVTLTTDDGLELSAWWLPPPVGSDAAVIVFPGNAGNRAGRVPLAVALGGRGLGVLLVDYRGYGGNPGSPSEQGLFADARAARDWIGGVQAIERVVYLGESLGSGPATALALDDPPAALVLRSPFTSLADIGRVHYPFLPVGLMLRDRYPVVDQIADVAAPVVVVAGSEDSIVPIDQSRRVAEVAGARLVVVEGAEHNDPELAGGGALVEALIGALGDPIGP